MAGFAAFASPLTLTELANTKCAAPAGSGRARHAFRRRDIDGAKRRKRIRRVLAHHVGAPREVEDDVRTLERTHKRVIGDFGEIAHRQHVRPCCGRDRQRAHQAAKRNARDAEMCTCRAPGEAIGAGHDDETARGSRSARAIQNHFQP